MTLCLPLSLRFPALEHCCTGGEALLPEEQEQWKRQTGILLYQAYGQSETVGEMSLLDQSRCAYPLSLGDKLNHAEDVKRHQCVHSIAQSHWEAPELLANLSQTN